MIILLICLFIRRRRTPRSTLFPYTTLFRSKRLVRGGRRSNGHALRLKIFPVHLAVVKAIDEQHDLWRTNSRHVLDRKSTRLNSSHTVISYAVFCLKKKQKRSLY